MLNFQEHSQRASGLFHDTLAGVGGVVAGTHGLLWTAVWAGLVAERAATPAHPGVPQASLPRAALDVLARLGL